MNHAVEKFLHELREKNAAGYAYPPLSITEIETFERAHGITLPDELRELYQQIGGQESEVLNTLPYRLLPLAEIAQVQARLLAHIEQTFGADWPDFRLPVFEDNGTVRNTLYNPAWIPVFQNHNNDFYNLDYAPANGGQHGQIIAVMGDPQPENAMLLLMFDTFEECLEDIAGDIKDDTMQNMDSFFTHTGQELEKLGKLLQQTPLSELYDLQIRLHIERTLGTVTHKWYGPDEKEGQQGVRTYYLPANEERPFQLLISSGMGNAGLMEEDAGPLPCRSEVLMLLPPDWPIFRQEDEMAAWPLHWINVIARMPRTQGGMPASQSIFKMEGDGHLPGTQFSGFLMYPPAHSLPQAFMQLPMPDGSTVTFYALIPLHPDEITQCDEEGGMTRLFAAFAAKGVTEQVVIHRPDYSGL